MKTKIEPMEDDMFISCDGWRFSVSVDGKHIGTFIEQEDVEQCAKSWMEKNNYHPSVWFVSDHGNISQYKF